MKSINSKILYLILFLNVYFTAACREAPPADASMKWGFVNGGRTANILNLEPNESMAICAPSEDWLVAAKAAVEQWSTVIGRWGHFKIVNCGETSDLSITMEGFGKYGLNYYNANPGRIYLLSSARDGLLTALALHEYGHSFGMCDQYPSVNNCTSLSSAKDNDEVMGSTHKGKTRLTPGDIEGVKRIANNPEVRSTAVWQKYLAENPQINGGSSTNESAVYVQVVESNSSTAQKLNISVDSGSDLALCINGDSSSECAQGSNNEIATTKSAPINGRDIYEATISLSQLSSSKTVFIATVSKNSDKKSSKFALNKK